MIKCFLGQAPPCWGQEGKSTLPARTAAKCEESRMRMPPRLGAPPDRGVSDRVKSHGGILLCRHAAVEQGKYCIGFGIRVDLRMPGSCPKAVCKWSYQCLKEELAAESDLLTLICKAVDRLAMLALHWVPVRFCQMVIPLSWCSDGCFFLCASQIVLPDSSWT